MKCKFKNRVTGYFLTPQWGYTGDTKLKVHAEGDYTKDLRSVWQFEKI